MRVLKIEHFSQLEEQKQAETEFMSLNLKEKPIRLEERTVTSSGHRVRF